MFFDFNIMELSRSRAVVLLFTVLGWLISSCVQMEDYSDEVGYLSFSLISVDYKIENIAPTKVTVPADDLPELEDFTVRIDGPIDEPLVYNPGELPSEKVALPVGTYSVEVIYGANDFGTPYYYASKSITISPKADANVSFADIPMGNAMLAIRVSADVSHHLNISKIQLSDGVRTVDISADVYVYVPSQKSITMTIIGTNKSTNERKKIDIPLGEMEPKHACDITCNLSSLPQIVLPDQSAGAWATRLYVTPATIDAALPSDQVIYEVTSSDWNSLTAVSEKIDGDYHVVKGLKNGSTYKVRARIGNIVSNEVSFTVDEFKQGAAYNVAHSYDASEYLTGTAVTADLKLTGILKTLHDAGLIKTTITFKNGSTVYRSSAASSGTLTDSDNWPYIPKGNTYTLDITHNVTGQTDIVKSSITSIEVPAPKVSVDVSAYTTYDWYKAGNLTNANNYDKRLVVEDRKAVLKISNNILQNTKYTSLLTASSVKYANGDLATFAVADNASNTLTYGNVTYTDSQWGSYPFTAAVTFDGTNATDTHDCWITGLPYSINFYNNESGLDNSAWTQNNIEYSNNKCCITYNGSNGYLISPKFQVPAGINVKNTVQAQAYRAGASPYNAKLRIGLTSSANSVASSYNEYSLSPNTSTGQSYETVSPEFTLTPNSPYISLHHNTPSKHWTMAWVYICIYQCSVEYKL